MLPAPAVRELAAVATVRVLPQGSKVWTQGDQPAAEIYFLARGRVEYLWTVDGRSERVDVRDVGDVLGLTAVMRGEAFRVTAQAAEDSLLYTLAWPPLRVLLETHDEARHYVRRHQFWISRTGMPMPATEPAAAVVTGRAKNILQAHLDGAQRVEPRPLERLLTCGPDASLLEAADLMSSKRVPSILVVDDERRPLGIVTASSLVKEVIVSGRDKQEPVSRVMARPVVTISPRSSATAAILLMLRERIGQVCVTDDGTPQGKALDVCTHKDLLAQSGHHPAGLLRELRLARTPARFRELCDEIEAIARSYLEAGISAIYLGQICAELYDELVQRLLVLAVDEVREAGGALPRTAWAWLSVGSDGRREQILRTDMDNAIVFASLGSPEADEQARTVFIRLATAVVDRLAAAGFSRCQGGVMAQNPRWCRTLPEWLAEMKSPDLADSEDGLLRAAVLFDLRFVAGDKALADELRQGILKSTTALSALQQSLAGQVIDAVPPLNLIGRFVVETLGVGGTDFDLKSRGLAPLRDAARVLSMKYQLNRRYSTGGRWEEIRRSIPRLDEVAGLAIEAYDFLLRLRTLNGLKRGDSGRQLDPQSLTKVERAQLANAFDVVRLVQSSLRIEFHIETRRL
ncbi:MAG: CBS domain-containing protein [Opitutaceae bacterium]|nr:CBS domain-containing protein [Opitutaceae bacterium]